MFWALSALLALLVRSIFHECLLLALLIAALSHDYLTPRMRLSQRLLSLPVFLDYYSATQRAVPRPRQLSISRPWSPPLFPPVGS